MNIAIIFAGGRGTRMGDVEVPKQFLEVAGKPIIILAIEAFQKNENIDKIIVVTLSEWIEQTWNFIRQYGLDKVEDVVEGGETGQLSIFNGVKRALELYGRDNIILINDGVRPFISSDDIEKSIEVVKEVGASAVAVQATETVAKKEGDSIDKILNRDECVFLKAPQSFYLGEFYDCDSKAVSEGRVNFVDSASLMSYYGKKIGLVETSYDNIKITTKKDIIVAEAISKRISHT
ncbi:2-C-methyl-D-erythritol 4-phosphate cytidylyltransferase [Candidatus Saccharibacteria bacterium]|nr:2-C-methyl-D-erythritol 4-phosphate cytidylyltransferase [Candidatus Saccharibacteria bacterium]